MCTISQGPKPATGNIGAGFETAVLLHGRNAERYFEEVHQKEPVKLGATSRQSRPIPPWRPPFDWYTWDAQDFDWWFLTYFSSSIHIDHQVLLSSGSRIGGGALNELESGDLQEGTAETFGARCHDRLLLCPEDEIIWENSKQLISSAKVANHIQRCPRKPNHQALTFVLRLLPGHFHDLDAAVWHLKKRNLPRDWRPLSSKAAILPARHQSKIMDLVFKPIFVQSNLPIPRRWWWVADRLQQLEIAEALEKRRKLFAEVLEGQNWQQDPIRRTDHREREANSIYQHPKHQLPTGPGWLTTIHHSEENHHRWC